MIIKVYDKLPAVVKHWLGIFAAAGRTLLDSQAFIYAAALAFFTFFSIAPILALLLLWVNYSSKILLFGAAFTRAHLEGRGKPIRPKRTAVCVHRELIEGVQQR